MKRTISVFSVYGFVAILCFVTSAHAWIDPRPYIEKEAKEKQARTKQEAQRKRELQDSIVILNKSASKKEAAKPAVKKTNVAEKKVNETKENVVSQRLDKLANQIEINTKKSSNSSLRDFKELLRQKGMTPEEEKEFEVYEVFLSEIGQSNSVLRAAVLRFFELYVEGQDADVKGRYQSVLKALKKFKTTKDKINKNAGKNLLNKKAENCQLYALQMNRIAWICKLLRNARMHDRISYCKGEDKEKQNYLLNEGAKAMLSYSLAVYDRACKDVKTRLAKLSNKARKNKFDNTKLGALVGSVEAHLDNVQKRKTVGLSTMRKGNLIKRHRGYHCSVNIQQSMKRTFSALARLEKELEKSGIETAPKNKKEKRKGIGGGGQIQMPLNAD